jgi:hypothetical protein
VRYNNLQAVTKVDLAARVTVFNEDVDAWTTVDKATAAGLSASQRVALFEMIAGLKQRQQKALQTVERAANPEAFGDAMAAFILETTGANELWRVFRSILEQAEDDRFQQSVRVATRIAGDCYAHCIRKARVWEAIAPDRLREQPLVYLDAIDSPATAGRGTNVQLLSLAIRQWRSLTLPLPFVLLPVNFARSVPCTTKLPTIWTRICEYCKGSAPDCLRPWRLSKNRTGAVGPARS